ncbi:FtsX-like permease family protein [Rossellomorea marisflavi]|uniref:FtsX-like permease family protein n=1 Tax=Rossellomorea marisflavi TaxID=189381 RepID=UPI0028533715|nr:FtsX-like permease family protein [Rossellomorea marisflavi]MDR4939004.1 FtsX-like permease family protein [Rossellomorea marisflavi]
MNIINKLTLRHLKENKRRTMVTIIGVIISVAMVTAVSTLFVSFLDLMKHDNINKGGEWHVQYKDINHEQLDAIKSAENTDSVFLRKDLGYSKIEDPPNASKPYLFFTSLDEKGLKEMPIKLKDGRFPKNDGEVVVSEDILNQKNKLKIGDSLSVELGDRLMDDMTLFQDNSFNGEEEEFRTKEKASYTIVGTIKQPEWEYPWAPGYTVISSLDDKQAGSTAFVTEKKLSKHLFDDAKAFAKKHDITTVEFNHELLRYYGISNNDNLNATLFGMASIIVGIILIGSVALIYNAFAISVSERARHLGMLSSVGATKIQKRNSVFFEGAIIGLISIPIGLIAGIGGMAVTFWFMNTTLTNVFADGLKISVSITPFSILAACAVSIVTIFISTLIPARRASKVSAIDAIRQTQDVKMSGRSVKTSKLTRKMFGIEGEIGLKNLKRNKKRYIATVFSLVISIILFLSVSFFTDNIKKSAGMTQENYDFDIQLTGSSNNLESLKPFVNAENVTDSVLLEYVSFQSWLTSKDVPSALKKDPDYHANLNDGKYAYNLQLHGLDEEDFKEYLKKTGSKVDPDGVVVINMLKYQGSDRKFYQSEALDLQKTKELDLYEFNGEEDEKVGSIQIDGETDEAPMGVRVGYGLNLVMSRDTLHKIQKETGSSNSTPFLYLNSSDPSATQEAIDESKSGDVEVFNISQMKEENEQFSLLVSIFAYGFITLISAISIANIFNTISTSISLRKREFAMLKSVGMTPKGFNKMIHYESIFYGLKSLLYGLPIGFAAMYLMHMALNESFEYSFSPPWMSVLFVVVAIFAIVGSAMLYSTGKIKKQNIIDGLKQENI